MRLALFAAILCFTLPAFGQYTPIGGGGSTVEVDPVWSVEKAGYAGTGSVALIQGRTNDWNAAYGWGDHSTAGYAGTGAVSRLEDQTNTWNVAYPSSNPSNFYPASNPSNWVTQIITNGLPYVPVAGGILSGILNHGGYGVTNFNGLFGYGNVWITNTMFALGSTDNTKAKFYVSGEAGVATNLPLVWLNRSSLATGPILQWGVNGTTNGSIDVNGNLTLGTGKINSIWTNAGTFQMSAITTQLVSLAMSGSAWSFRKPMIWSTNISFSATAKVSLFNNLPLAGCTEMWRNKSVAIASVTNSTPLLLGTNIVPVIDGTPFSTITDPFQIVIVDGASSECMTITNVTGNSLYSAFPSQFSHAGNVVVSHGCSLNVPGWINDESGGTTLRLYVEFPTAQTVGIGYSLPYVRVQ